MALARVGISLLCVASMSAIACSGSNAGDIPKSDVASTDPSGTSPGTGPNGTGPGTPGGPTPTGTGTGQPTPPPPANGAPTITAVTFDKSTLGPGDDVTIDVTITDPDGPNDVTGGSLVSAASTNPVVAFARQPGGGWRAKAALAAFDAVEPLTLGPAETAHRTFTVRFVDTAGHVATKDVALDFSGKDKGICNGGVVASFYRDCVACASSCPSGTTCLGNVCSAQLDCGFASFSCSQRCTDAGKSCLGSVVVTYQTQDQMADAFSTCGDQTKATYVFSAAACAGTVAGNAVRGCYCGK